MQCPLESNVTEDITFCGVFYDELHHNMKNMDNHKIKCEQKKERFSPKYELQIWSNLNNAFSYHRSFRQTTTRKRTLVGTLCVTSVVHTYVFLRPNHLPSYRHAPTYVPTYIFFFSLDTCAVLVLSRNNPGDTLLSRKLMHFTVIK